MAEARAAVVEVSETAAAVVVAHTAEHSIPARCTYAFVYVARTDVWLSAACTISSSRRCCTPPPAALAATTTTFSKAASGNGFPYLMPLFSCVYVRTEAVDRAPDGSCVLTASDDNTMRTFLYPWVAGSELVYAVLLCQVG